VEGKEMGRLLQGCLKRLEVVCEPPEKKRLRTAPILDKTPGRTCPACKRQMRRLNYAYDSNVIVDKCQACGSLFLDAGEIDSIARYLKCSWKLLRDFREKSKKIDEIYQQAEREERKGAVKGWLREAKEGLKESAKEDAVDLVMLFLSILLRSL
jgi:Zn-finger nucleic acid-binding protein